MNKPLLMLVCLTQWLPQKGKSRSYNNNNNSYSTHKQEMGRSYEWHVQQVEHRTFVPVVFLSGGQGKAATTLYCYIESMLADKRHEPLLVEMAYIRMELSVAIMKSAAVSHRGCGHQIHTSDFESLLLLTVSECNIS